MIKDTPDIKESEIYAIARCLKELIVNSNLNEALNNIVGWLAETLQIDRCYISEASTKEGLQNKITSINDGSVTAANSTAEHLHNISFDTGDFIEIRSILETNNPFKVSINDDISPALFNFLQASYLKSLLLIPVFSGGRYWGFIGFGDIVSPRTWRRSEGELKSLASAIGVAIETNRFKNEIQIKNEVYNLTLTSLNELVWEADLVNNTIKFAGSSHLRLKSGMSDVNRITASLWIDQNVHAEDAERVKAKYKAFLVKNEVCFEEDVYRIFNMEANAYVWVNSRYKLIKNEFGAAVKLAGTITEITDANEVVIELEKQREQYHFLVQSIGQVMFSLDNKGNFSGLSHAWEGMLGYAPQDCFGKNFIHYIPQEEIRHFWENFGSLFSDNKSTFDLQMQMLHKSGEKIWVRVLAKSTKDQNGKVAGVFGSIENINDRYTADLVLKESNDKLTTILNNSKEIILTIDLQNNVIQSVNDAISILGYKPEEWIGQDYKSWGDDQRKTFHELMKLAVKGQLQVADQQISFSNKNNTEVITFEFSTSIFSFKNSKYLLCVLRDISKRLEYEQNITRISNQLSHLINNIDDVYAIYDLPSQQFEFVSNNVENLYGCSKDSFTKHGLCWNEIIHLQDIPGVHKSLETIISSKTKGEFFYRISTPVGEVKMLLEKITVGKNEMGEAEKLYIVKTDYTHIENVERSLIESERKFRFISENISDFISIHDPDWNFTYASPSVKNILGYEPDEIVGLAGFDLVHPGDAIRTLDELLEPLVLEHKETQLRYRIKAKDGTYKWVETYSKAVIDSKGETSSIISSTRNVSDQVNAELRLKTSEEQYRLLSENSNDVIATYDLDGKYTYVSPSSVQVFGYTPSELIGKAPGDVLAKDIENKTTVNNNLSQIFKDGEARTYTYQAITKTGKIKSLEVVAKPVFRNNQVTSVQAAIRDVSERENLLIELEQALAKERELNELRSMFVSTASHQFRTPLTIIQSGVEIMEMYLEDLPENKQVRFQKQFNKIQGEVERLEFLMSDILLLGRANAARTPFHPENGDIVEFAENIINNKYNNRYPADRSVVLQVSGTPVLVDFDPKLIGHAIENIISNAYKYSEQGNLELGIAFLDTSVRLSITDAGIGIPEEDQKNLFQPFFRACNTIEIEGTGLGLAIVKEFVEKHHGEIFLTSILNKGTTVNVILPVKQN